ncbi:MAG: hypothetical protein ACI8UO_003325 [Verrucomicrobiales bacterium]
MNLKQFHVVFILLSILCTLGFSAWVFLVADDSIGLWGKVGGAGSALIGIALMFYGVWFIRKAKHITT